MSYSQKHITQETKIPFAIIRFIKNKTYQNIWV